MITQAFRLGVPGSLAAALLCWGPALAEEKEKTAKLPSPVKALQTALTNLTKSESYRAKVSIEGGISDREDHKVTETTVREAYEGEVFGSLMHVPRSKAFRYPKKGVAFVDGEWRNILSDHRTVRMERLFAFPEVILRRAVGHAPKSARWLTPEEEAKRMVSSDANDEPSPPQSPRGGTVPSPSPPKGAVGKTQPVKPQGAETARPAPRVVRVEAPPQEALKHFLEVQNSGCMSGG